MTWNICPLVGAYLILCVPTSVMLNTVFDRISEHGWRGDVERTVQKHLLPLQGHARRVVEEHRFVIPALRNYPGMFVRNEEKLQQMEKRKGKTGMEGFGPGRTCLTGHRIRSRARLGCLTKFCTLRRRRPAGDSGFSSRPVRNQWTPSPG